MAPTAEHSGRTETKFPVVFIHGTLLYVHCSPVVTL